MLGISGQCHIIIHTMSHHHTYHIYIYRHQNMLGINRRWPRGMRMLRISLDRFSLDWISLDWISLDWFSLDWFSLDLQG